MRKFLLFLLVLGFGISLAFSIPYVRTNRSILGGQTKVYVYVDNSEEVCGCASQVILNINGVSEDPKTFNCTDGPYVWSISPNETGMICPSLDDYCDPTVRHTTTCYGGTWWEDQIIILHITLDGSAGQQ